jgi:thymidylate kinase
MAQLVVITGPIAAGKNTVAALIADAVAALGRSAVLVDVDDVAAMVAGPGAATSGLWFAAHQAHGALVGTWMRTAVDVVIAVGPIYTRREQAALLQPLPEASAAHWVVIDAPVDVTLARAQAEPGRGRSREPEFHRAAHQRFRRLLPGIPAAQTFDSEGMSAEQIASAVLAAIGVR